MIKVFLNNLYFRYDVYQIINLFYALEDIKFVEEDEDVRILVEQDDILISFNDDQLSYLFNIEFNKKETVKLAVFNYLKNKTGKDFPWGTLIGIRPSKIALSLLNKGKMEEDIVEYYKEHFNASSEKAQLCIDVAKVENKFINKDKNTVSVYIGMPFCPTRCSYCSFAANPIAGFKSLVEPYLEALKKEIESTSRYINEKKLKIECVYFGGGTPTSVNDNQFEDIMTSIYYNLVADKDVKEFTVECGRPDSISFLKLQTMKNYNVHRISINPQSMNEETLRKIGRRHSIEDVVEKYNMARSIGFDNINMDVIVGLDGESLVQIQKTCSEIFKLDPDSITVHGLSIKRASKLHENIINEMPLEELSQSEINKMYNETFDLAKKLNMKPYYMYRQKNMFGNMENVGYSKPTKQGIYNIQMIEEKQTIIACGADAVSKVIFLDENRIERFANVKDVKGYINRIDEMISKKIQLLNSLY
ncbi:coproporphyrinogen III oxidase [Clostridium swellfunianum]|uniref:coproporphyrinogen III oxidase n=1 Tax=Clostridium swellfunianum TaxID=1367462 RepID=UPI00202F6162|nr:coproporphyrinogen III oxidase [Clostridium swellfunianum]MCM0648792.1 coproporphyrinogen III oxidase [Clostridium swellfunianum]